MTQFTRNVGVMSGYLIGNPQTDDAGASPLQRSCVWIGAITHFLRGGQNALARHLRNLGITRERKGNELARDAKLSGDLLLCNHVVSILLGQPGVLPQDGKFFATPGVASNNVALASSSTIYQNGT